MDLHEQLNLGLCLVKITQIHIRTAKFVKERGNVYFRGKVKKT